MITIQNLVKRYGDTVALDHLNLEIQEGEIFGLLGPNGSGKTTALNCLLALLKYDRGDIRIFGRPMTPVSYDIRQQIGVVFQNVAVFQQMSVQENIDFFCGSTYPTVRKEKIWWKKPWSLPGWKTTVRNGPASFPGVCCAG